MDFACLDILVLNEVEIRALGGDDDLAVCLQNLAARYPHLQILLTLGADGCMLVADGETLRQAAFETTVVDTTAAGDSFNAGFAVGLAMGDSLPDAIRLANAVGALSTTAAGAQAAMPTMAAAKELMDSQR